jgi:DNA/RNA-binding protein KIN17
VFDKYVALIRMNDSGDVLKIDQSQLETVIPQPGHSVRVVNGAYRGELGTLVSILSERFVAVVKLDSGLHLGSQVELPYEDISKSVTV